MARTALWAPAHRIMQRFNRAGQLPVEAAPSVDLMGNAYQDARLQWNTANSNVAGSVVAWLSGHSILDYVPATASASNIAASQTPVANTPLTLVSATGAGIVVSAAALLMLPSLITLPVGTLFIDAVPIYRTFGQNNFTTFYDAATIGSRAIQVHSVGNDSAATMNIVGYDSYGYLTHQALTMGSGSTVTTTKTFKSVLSMTPTGTLSGSAVTAGVADVFGLPWFATTASSIWGFFNNLILAGTGTFVGGVTTTPSATTGDVRGTYVPGSASDGTKRFTLFQQVNLSTLVSSGPIIGMTGQPQF